MEIPLFPLHTVLCPGIVLPLHVFEDRYRALTRHCLDTGAPFGVVLIRDGREVGTGRALALAGVGALVEIREAGRYPDGRYDLLAAATGRFAIETVDPAREPYLVADVTPLDDEVGDEARAERLAACGDPALRPLPGTDAGARRRDQRGPRHPGRDRQHRDRRRRADRRRPGRDRSTRRRRRRRRRRRDRGPSSPVGDLRRDLVIPDDPTVLSYLLSGIVQIELPRRQALLEAPTTVDRLEALVSSSIARS